MVWETVYTQLVLKFLCIFITLFVRITFTEETGAETYLTRPSISSRRQAEQNKDSSRKTSSEFFLYLIHHERGTEKAGTSM